MPGTGLASGERPVGKRPSACRHNPTVPSHPPPPPECRKVGFLDSGNACCGSTHCGVAFISGCRALPTGASRHWTRLSLSAPVSRVKHHGTRHSRERTTVMRGHYRRNRLDGGTIDQNHNHAPPTPAARRISGGCIRPKPRNGPRWSSSRARRWSRRHRHLPTTYQSAIFSNYCTYRPFASSWPGLAWLYDRYVTDRSLYQLKDEVRAARRDLWTYSGPVSRWEWRRKGRVATSIFAAPSISCG